MDSCFLIILIICYFHHQKPLDLLHPYYFLKLHQYFLIQNLLDLLFIFFLNFLKEAY